MKFFPRTTSLFDDMFDDMFTSPFFANRNDMAMKTDITGERWKLHPGYGNCRDARKKTSIWS